MITEKDFICKGNGSFVRYNEILYVDCKGGHLPSFGIDKYLLWFLNKIDKEYGIKITSGHRCFKHNLFSWALLAFETGDTKSIKKYYSKHIYGKGSDFITKEYTGFTKLEHIVEGYRKKYGKNLWFKVYDINEGRDSDNNHKLPYVHVQKRSLNSFNSGNFISTI